MSEGIVITVGNRVPTCGSPFPWNVILAAMSCNLLSLPVDCLSYRSNALENGVYI